MMKQPTFTVYCGQDLPDSFVSMEDADGRWIFKFPEAGGGCRYVSKLVNGAVTDMEPCVFMTRYSHVIDSFGVLIGAGALDPAELKIVLIEWKDDHLVSTEHKMTADGVMDETWPFGILTY